MKLKVWSFYWKNNDGYTLLEILIVLVVLGILVVQFIGIISFISKVVSDGKTNDRKMGEVNRTLEYMTYEIKRADEILDLINQKDYDYFIGKYPDNLGVLIKIKETNTNLFLTYCLDGNKLRRMSFRTKNDELNGLRKLEGYNLLSEGVYGLSDSIYNQDNMYLDIRIKVNNKYGVENYSQLINIYCGR